MNRVRMLLAVMGTWSALVAVTACSAAPETPAQQTFATPDDAVKALIEAAKSDSLDSLLALLGPEGKDLAATSDAATARANRAVFVVAANEGWRLTDEGPDRKTLVIGNESWPFPVPLVADGGRWRFDAEAGAEEVIARRIGRNELAVIETCRTYVAAQRHYAQEGHDGKRAGLYAQSFASQRGKQDGLYWPHTPGGKRSPLGDWVAQAAEDGQAVPTEAGQPPATFHGYRFRILTSQGAAAPGGARSYLVNGEMSGGFALVAWPAQYDVTGVMTFIVNQSGRLFEKDLGEDTVALAHAMPSYDPDDTWKPVE
jgi:hypothetical protein